MRRVLCFGIVAAMILCSLPLNIFAAGNTENRPAAETASAVSDQNQTESIVPEGTKSETGSPTVPGDTKPETSDPTDPPETDESTPGETTSPADPITYTYVGEKAPTCEADGCKAHYVGSDGGLYLGEEKTPVSSDSLKIPALGHQWGSASYHWNGKNCSAGRSCSRCGATQSDQARIYPYHNITKPGTTTYKAYFSADWAKQFNGVEIVLKDGEAGPTDPTDPPATDPTDPPATDPTDPPATDPTDPPETDPTDPPETDPTDPPATDPTDPPATDPTDPPATDPTDPPETDPTEPESTHPHIPEPPAPPDPKPVRPHQPTVPTEETEVPAEPSVEPGQVPAEPEPTQSVITGYPEKLGGIKVQDSENGIVLSLKPKPQNTAMKASVSLRDLEQICANLEPGETLSLTCGRLALDYDGPALDEILRQAEGADRLVFSMEKQRSDDRSMNGEQKAAVQQYNGVSLFSIDLSAQYGDTSREIHDFGEGSSQITVPHRFRKGSVLTVYRVEENGSLTELPCQLDPDSGTVCFETPSHSHYMVVSTLNVVIFAWVISGILTLGLFIVMFKNRKGYLLNLF